MASDQLKELVGTMMGKGWQALPVFADGKEQLLISGFSSNQQVLDTLASHQAVTGQPSVSETNAAEQQQWLRRNSLKAAGILNLIGDASLLASGIKSSDAYKTTGGALYTAGALALTRYGNIDTQRQMKRTLHEVRTTLDREVTGLSNGTALQTAARDAKTGSFAAAEDFVYHNPADVMLGAYSLGAAAMLGSGIKQKNTQRIMYGGWSLLVKTVSFLLPEKKKTAKDDKRSSITDQPLKIFGIGSAITEVLLGASAYKQYKSGKHNAKQRTGAYLEFGTAGAYLLADVLMAMSSKDSTKAGGVFTAAEKIHIEAMAADAIARAPQDKQADLIERTAMLLADKPEMQASKEQVAQSLAEQIEHRQKNPWVARVAEAQPEQPAVSR